MDMIKQQQPVPGNYYVNLTGQLIKVRYLLYSNAELSTIVLEYQDGCRLFVSLDEWDWLDLRPYSDWFFGDKSVDSGQEY